MYGMYVHVHVYVCMSTYMYMSISCNDDVMMMSLFQGDVIFNELGIRQVTQYLILQFRKNSSNNSKYIH